MGVNPKTSLRAYNSSRHGTTKAGSSCTNHATLASTAKPYFRVEFDEKYLPYSALRKIRLTATITPVSIIIFERMKMNWSSSSPLAKSKKEAIFLCNLENVSITMIWERGNRLVTKF